MNLLEVTKNLFNSVQRSDPETLAIQYALADCNKAIEKWEKRAELIEEITEQADCYQHHSESYMLLKSAQMRGVKLSVLDTNDIQFIERRISIDLLKKVVDWIKESV